MESIKYALAVVVGLASCPVAAQETNEFQNFWSVAINPDDRGRAMEIGATFEEAQEKAIATCNEQALTDPSGCIAVGTFSAKKGDVVVFTKGIRINCEEQTNDFNPLISNQFNCDYKTFATVLTIGTEEAMQKELEQDCAAQIGEYNKFICGEYIVGPRPGVEKHFNPMAN